MTAPPDIKPERLVGPGRITVEGGCESFGKTEIRLLPQGESVLVELENVGGHYHYFWHLPSGVLRLVLGQQELAWFTGGLRALLVAQGGAPSFSTANRTIRVELMADSGALTAALEEDASPSVEGVDEFLHGFAAEVWRRAGGVEGARPVPVFAPQVAEIVGRLRGARPR